MKTNFTPGPWIVSQSNDGKEVFVKPIPGQVVAVIEPTPEATGNAALIAAAPEMHEQLVKALEWLDAIESGVSMPEMRRASIQAFLQEIRGTLNKVGS
jgi:hypothetical protein